MQLYLDCPCTSFPRSFARDYKETYQYPPPSTVYGLLLSLVGEVDMEAHRGVKLVMIHPFLALCGNNAIINSAKRTWALTLPASSPNLTTRSF
jgi:CRISPR-associated Cas5-like protein